MAKIALTILLAALNSAHEQVEKNGIYYHYKDRDKFYKVIELAIDTHDEENHGIQVIYQTLYVPGTWARPLKDWLSDVEVNGVKMKKFTKQKIRFGAGGVVVNSLTGKVLVVNQNGNSWSLPKGGIDPDEDTLVAAQREIYEESGINQLTFVKKLGNYQRYAIPRDGSIDKGEDKNLLKDLTFFLFTTEQEELCPQDSDNPEARWVDKEKVADLLTHPRDKEFFLSILSLI